MLLVKYLLEQCLAYHNSINTAKVSYKVSEIKKKRIESQEQTQDIMKKE